MLPKKHRFSHRLSKDFFDQAQVVNTSFLRIFVLPQVDSTNPAQVMVVVPKKVAAKATLRTHLKRQIQAAVLPHLEQLTGWQAVFYLKRLPQNQTTDES